MVRKNCVGESRIKENSYKCSFDRCMCNSPTATAVAAAAGAFAIFGKVVKLTKILKLVTL